MLAANWYQDFLMGSSGIPRSSQNSKFAMSLQYLKKEVRDEDDFLDADKHWSFLQAGFNTLKIKVSYKVISMIMKTWRPWWWA